ncbi:MAG: TSUP family transporter [Candidatus Aminicenantes bacterium]|nr:TSUP family transporter [Candidatus Aminicenantes bacterium]
MILTAAVIILITFVAAVFGTISGFGISTLMVPVILFFYPLPVTLLFVAIIHFAGDIWKIIFFKRGIRWKLILSFGIPGIIASYVGASVVLNVSPDVMKRILGVFLLSYVLFLLSKKEWRIHPRTTTGVVGGSLYGFSAGVFGIGGAVRSAFLTAYNLPKEVYIFTAGFIALFVDITRITKYISGEQSLHSFLLVTLAVCVPVSFLGAYVAKKVVDKVPPKRFRILIALFIGLMALKLLVIP